MGASPIPSTLEWNQDDSSQNRREARWHPHNLDFAGSGDAQVSGVYPGTPRSEMRGEHDSAQCPRGSITCLPLGALDSSGFRPHGLWMLRVRERMIYRVISPPSASCWSCTFQPGPTENRRQCWNGREIQKVTEAGLGCSEHHPVTGIGLNDLKDFV